MSLRTSPESTREFSSDERPYAPSSRTAKFVRAGIVAGSGVLSGILGCSADDLRSTGTLKTPAGEPEADTFVAGGEDTSPAKPDTPPVSQEDTPVLSPDTPQPSEDTPVSSPDTPEPPQPDTKEPDTFVYVDTSADTESGTDAADGTDGGADAQQENKCPCPLPAGQKDGDNDCVTDDKDPSFNLDSPDVPDPDNGCAAMDSDKDEISDGGDNCKGTKNTDQADSDNDGVGDECDTAKFVYNPPVCPACPQSDKDGDGVPDETDNAVWVPNADQTDKDGDKCAAEVDCNDDDPTVMPYNAPEVCANFSSDGSLNDLTPPTDTKCDGVDSDCNGVGTTTSENNELGTVNISGEEECECIPGTVVNFGSDEGECSKGQQECKSNGFGTSLEVTMDAVNGSAEKCGDGLDNNCSGEKDEECGPCTPGTVETCVDIDKGECAKTLGTKVCDDTGNFGGCTGAGQPAEKDLCNGLNEDCDDETDEGFDVEGDCPAVGECPAGKIECDGVNKTKCSTTDPKGSSYQGTEEKCNEKDDDCDGETDEDPCPVLGSSGGEKATIGDLCKTGKGDCEEWSVYKLYKLSDGTPTNAVTCAVNAVPGVEICDKGTSPHNEDCDDMTNENCGGNVLGDKISCTPVGQPYVCADGTSAFLGVDANGNPLWDVCKDYKLGQAEIPCNGEDDDCDKIVDETPQGKPGDSCEKYMQGVCKEGSPVWICDPVTGEMVCTGEFNAAPKELCGNGKDDDCKDGVDGGKYPKKDDPAGQMAAVGEFCTTGLGDCAENTNYTCAPGGLNVECAGTKKPGPEVCDPAQNDEDCDGMVNENCGGNVNGDKTPCQTEPIVCAQGKSTFNNGVWGPCEGQVFGETEVCNYIDDDCDGLIDEGYIPAGGFLGMDKLCLAPGECAFDKAGQPVWGHLACNPTDPKADAICSTGPLGKSDLSVPEKCNTKDDDCDKTVDENFDTLGLPCSIGEPNNTECVGVVSCTLDQKGADCKTAIKPNQHSEECDGVDNNCVNGVDEGFDKGGTCYTTKCNLQGVKVCTADGSAAVCSAKDPAEVPANNVDDDCDGLTDENP